VTDQLPAELATWPAWTPDEAQLGELELITSGAYTPLTGYLGTADLASVGERGELADGTPWPVPVTLTAPTKVVPEDASRLVLQDPEGAPLAVVAITERILVGGGTEVRLAGPVTALRPAEHGPFRALRRAPFAVRAELDAGPVLALATRRPLGQRQRYGGRSA
jgi:sulfate adenylyltransferase